MGNVSTKGIVLKQNNYGEADRMLTVFTAEYGIIKAAARGARRMKNRFGAAAQFLCYSDFELFMSNSEVASINAISVNDAFYPASEDISLLALFTYISDITVAGLGFSNPDERILRLFLNTLYMCAYKGLAPEIAKVVYELRMMGYIGFAPMIGQCMVCGGCDDFELFDLNGGVVCGRCKKNVGKGLKMTENVYRALCYILASEERRVFSFKASKDVITSLGQISEKYVNMHLDKEFSSLDYFKKILT